MKLAGLIGGMSWASSVNYYELINRGVQQRLGGLHSARLLMYSVEFSEIAAQQREGRWDDSAATLSGAARSLVAAGAECIVICANTMHKVADVIQQATGVPLLHVADATGERVRNAGMKRIALLGTRFTMEHDFYRSRLEARFGLEVLVPPEEDRELLHRVIYEELCLGTVDNGSRAAYLEIIRGLQRRGAQGVILGCTEIGMLVTVENSPLPVFDTTKIHADAVVEWMLGSKSN